MTTMRQCPVAHAYDPLIESALVDPFTPLEELRDLGPVFYSPVLERWVVTGYAEVEQVLLDPPTFSAAETLRPVYPVCDQARSIIGGMLALSGDATLVTNDPPVHTRYRSAMMRVISPRRIARLETLVRDRCVELIEAVRGEGRADIVAALCHPLPTLTIFGLLGFPEEEIEQIEQWCGNHVELIWGRPSPEQQVSSAHGMVSFFGYCRELVGKRRLEPADDLVSEMIVDERELTDDEIASFIFELSFAGHVTTTGLLGNMLVQLLSQRGAWAEVTADRSLIPGAVEETLRFDPPVLTARRITTREVELAGVTLPAGARIVLNLGAADRDPERFTEPGRFDARRAEARRQLTFGKGIHLCPGAPLARLEGKVVLEELTERLPGLRIVGGQHLSYSPNISLRGPRSLLVEWD